MKGLVGLTWIIIIFSISLAYGAANVWDFVDPGEAPGLPQPPSSLESLHILDLWDPGGSADIRALLPSSGVSDIGDLWDRSGADHVQDLWTPPDTGEVWDFQVPEQSSDAWDFSSPPASSDLWDFGNSALQ